MSDVWNAAFDGDEARLKRLIDTHGNDKIEWRNFDGSTPLRAASYMGHQSCVDLLLKAGANPNTQTPGGYTPLGTAAANGRLKTVSALVEAGADVDLATEYGTTPLMNAVSFSQSRIVLFLLDAGANWRLKDKAGKTALDMASEARNVAIIYILNKQEHKECEERPRVVKASGSVLPVELAELCGDYVFLTPVRRALEKRTHILFQTPM